MGERCKQEKGRKGREGERRKEVTRMTSKCRAPVQCNNCILIIMIKTLIMIDLRLPMLNSSTILGLYLMLLLCKRASLKISIPQGLSNVHMYVGNHTY